ncbi:RNA polymerase sigma factor [Chitinophaga sp. 22620]|uniref:RNA polymerase sigma factor n=1 Tax=Chitinophaga sp. 22620 TaxID=3453952 RepID=UPI003F85ADB3
MTAGIQNDILLWQQVKQGDRPAFDQLYHRYAGPIFAMVYKHIRNRADAEDIIQEVFLSMWEKRMAIDIQHSLFNYLYSTARNRTLRHIKLNGSRPESLDLFRELLDEHGLAETSHETHSRARMREIESSIAGEIAGLPEQMKKVYLMNSDGGMSIPEIAGLLQISPHTVRNHIAKVRKRLRRIVSRLASLFSVFPALLLFLVTVLLP